MGNIRMEKSKSLQAEELQEWYGTYSECLGCKATVQNALEIQNHITEIKILAFTLTVHKSECKKLAKCLWISILWNFSLTLKTTFLFKMICMWW